MSRSTATVLASRSSASISGNDRLGRGLGEDRRPIRRISSSAGTGGGGRRAASAGGGRAVSSNSSACGLGAGGAGQRHQLGAAAARRGLDRADADRQRAARDRRAERQEVRRARGRGSRSACRRSMPSRSAARAMSMSRKVRPIRKFDASAATFLASLASRCVAMTPASPRLRPRHIRLVIAASEAVRASSRHLAGRRRARTAAPRRPRPAPGYQCSRGASNSAVQEGGGAAHLRLDLEPFEVEHDRGAVLRGCARRCAAISASL